jgi:uncharacterized membrane protein YidH (DUF202 family)
VKFCHKCGTRAIDDKSVFCNKCGTQYIQSPPEKKDDVCQSCGTKILDKQSVFCNKCGSQISALPPVTVQQIETQPVVTRSLNKKKSCPACGASIVNESKYYCDSCGAYLRGSDPINGPINSPKPKKEKIAARNPWIAAILSFLFVGWGQWYNGKTWDGLKFFGAVIAIYILAFVFKDIAVNPSFSILNILTIILYIIGLGIVIYGMYDAFTTAEKINRGEESFSGKSGLFWLPVALIVLAILVIILAVMAAFVFGMAGAVAKTKVVAITASRPSPTQILVSNMGGPDAASLNALDINGDVSGNLGIEIGSVTTIKTTTGKKHVIVAGTFTDGVQQILLDTMI